MSYPSSYIEVKVAFLRNAITETSDYILNTEYSDFEKTLIRQKLQAAYDAIQDVVFMQREISKS